MAHRVIALPPTAAFELITDLTRHSEWIPLTRIQGPATPRAGARYSALSAGVIRDRMELERFEPPRPGGPVEAIGVAEYRKHGPVLLGRARITVSPGAGPGSGASLVNWEYDAWLAGLPPSATRAVLTRALDAMAALALWRASASVATSVDA